jgi:hypothetical protein
MATAFCIFSPSAFRTCASEASTMAIDCIKSMMDRSLPYLPEQGFL